MCCIDLLVSSVRLRRLRGNVGVMSSLVLDQSLKQPQDGVKIYQRSGGKKQCMTHQNSSGSGHSYGATGLTGLMFLFKTQYEEMTHSV